MEKKKKRGGKNSRSKSRSRNIARGECAFCHEKGHWRKDCSNAQKRDEKKPVEVNMARKDEDSDYSLSITHAAYVASSTKGYKVTIEDDTMKFTHGAMVILQGVRRHNLYYLNGGKKTRVKFGTANHDTRKILEYVHSDVWGPTKTASIGGSHYFVTFVDDFSRCVKIKVFQSDNGGEYTSDPFLQVYQNEGIKRHFTMRHTPQQNGVAERMNRTLLEKVRCMLSDAGLDKKFWAEAVSYASHLINRLPSAVFGGKTPMKMWSGKHAQDYDSLRIFWCPIYYHVKDDKKFVCSRDVTFDEASMMKASSSQQVENKTKEVTPRVKEEVVSSDVPQNEETIDDVDNDDFIATRRPRKEIKKLKWLTKDMVVAYALPVIDNDIPNTFGEALRSSKSDQWKLAMEEEMKSLHQNQTWELVELPKGEKTIGNKWVYTKNGGSAVAFSDSRPFQRIYGDSGEGEFKKKKVVVLGTGWAGTTFLKNLKSNSFEVQVVSPRNYFAFTPLLPSVTNGTVEARSIVEPTRNIVRKKGMDIQFKEAECYKIDAEKKKIYCRTTEDRTCGGKEEFALDYDILVIAMGAQPNTFNTPGVVEHAHFLKEVEHAQRIRRSVIDCFERASLPNLSDEERKKILHFVVVGGGPTGVEFAAALHDFVIDDLSKLYPSLKEFTRITLLEAGDHILNMFDKRITASAEEKFKRDGIDLKTGSMVVKLSDKEISTKDRATGQISSIPYGMVVWSTGIGTRPVIMDFMKQIGQANRRVLATDEWLRVEGCESVYALGDCATINQRKVMEDISAIFSKADKNNTGKLNVKDLKEVVKDICERYPQVEIYLNKKQLKNINVLLKNAEEDPKKASMEFDIEKFKKALSEVDSQMKHLPATAQVAAQEGAYLANCFNRMEQCEKNPEGPLRFRGAGRHRFHPFRYKHFGQFAPLGGEEAAAQLELPFDWISVGRGSQWLCKQISWRTRFLVISDWRRRFMFGRDSSRI
ncbi:External alternative NAD(P)H-ubiquinone oxidoreductase B4 [Citrus sinensis]|nr:External alternative NAD(P)H-ubiquinone oxidoreductase B4 [Citrus sinensis]